MQGRNTVEEVLCLSAKRCYTVFYKNCKESNVLSDIVIPHPTSIAMIKTSPYVLIMDTTYKTNKYNIPLLEAVGMTSTGKNFTVATAFMRNEQDSTNKWSMETTNRAESEHSVLKIWLSTCHGDLDTVFLNVDSVIESQIAEIKSLLENSKLKEKFNARSNPILKNISNRICHWALKKIWCEIKRARELVNDAQNKFSHYLRKSHGLPCVCELLSRYEHCIPLQLEDVSIFWRTLEIGVHIPSAHAWDIESEICDLTTMLDEISTVTKERQKTNSTKRDKSYWEHVSISHRKIGKSSGSGIGSGSGFGFGSGSNSRGRGRPPRDPKGKGRSSERSNLSSIVNPCTPVIFLYIDAFSGFVYEFIPNSKNVIGNGNCGFRVVAKFLFRDGNHWPEWFDGPTPEEHWSEIPYQLYVIANTFNFCVVLITELQLRDGCPLPLLNVQWEYHRHIQLSSWEEPYSVQIAD
ncbi:hypothetical protein M9H77_17823 [Catharanthus roseus]|uniref:Uncharacterized protein n=1 Tax=Catharanthus roseus TaxID=4058 RepID=A0ACC0B5N7_CATRO|nr:hypothetical protein M9H77_17823 [Catharanthus roseus]